MGSVYPIETIRVPAYNTTSIIFDSIPQTYKHLEIIGQASFTGMSRLRSEGGFLIQLNTNTASTWTMDVWNGYSTSSNATIANDNYNIQQNWWASGQVGLASAAGWRFRMNDYSTAGTVKNLVFQSHGYCGVGNNSSGYMYPGDKYGCESMDGAITDAVSKINIQAQGGASFVMSSEFTLYGWDDA